MIDRQNSSGIDTPSVREYITFTGIDGNNITGCTRGVSGSTQQSHSSGALVEETMSVKHWGDLGDFLNVAHDTDGKLVTSTATISTLRVITHLNASGASLSISIPSRPVWVIGGTVSLATTSVGKPLPAANIGNFKWVSMMLRTPASGASLIIDINVQGTTIFSDQNTRLMIPGGGTYASTASIGNPGVTPGKALTVDIDSGGGLGQDLTIVGYIE